MLQVLSLLFWFKLTRMPSRVWSYEQKWIGAVLVGLVFFNNPLVGVEVFFPSLVWTGLSVIGMVTFLALLLLFWLCIIDVVRTSASDEQVCVCARVCVTMAVAGGGWVLAICSGIECVRVVHARRVVMVVGAPTWSRVLPAKGCAADSVLDGCHDPVHVLTVRHNVLAIPSLATCCQLVEVLTFLCIRRPLTLVQATARGGPIVQRA